MNLCNLNCAAICVAVLKKLKRHLLVANIIILLIKFLLKNLISFCTYLRKSYHAILNVYFFRIIEFSFRLWVLYKTAVKLIDEIFSTVKTRKYMKKECNNFFKNHAFILYSVQEERTIWFPGVWVLSLEALWLSFCFWQTQFPELCT